MFNKSGWEGLIFERKLNNQQTNLKSAFCLKCTSLKLFIEIFFQLNLSYCELLAIIGGPLNLIGIFHVFANTLLKYVIYIHIFMCQTAVLIYHILVTIFMNDKSHTNNFTIHLLFSVSGYSMFQQLEQRAFDFT